MFADRLIVMKDGAIAADGAPGDVLTDGLLEAVFALPLKVNRQPSNGTPFVLPHSADPVP
jgi:iron complex transport system ATP-binding protein